MRFLNSLSNRAIAQIILSAIFVSTFISGVAISIAGSRREICDQIRCFFSNITNTTNSTYFCNETRSSHLKFHYDCDNNEEICCRRFEKHSFFIEEELIIIGLGMVFIGFILYVIALAITALFSSRVEKSRREEYEEEEEEDSDLK